MMKTLLVKMTDEEKKRLDVAKAKSDEDNWRDFFLTLIEEDGE